MVSVRLAPRHISGCDMRWILCAKQLLPLAPPAAETGRVYYRVGAASSLPSSPHSAHLTLPTAHMRTPGTDAQRQAGMLVV